MFILKEGHQPGVYMLLRALFLVHNNFHAPRHGNTHHEVNVFSNVMIFRLTLLIILRQYEGLRMCINIMHNRC